MPKKALNILAVDDDESVLKLVKLYLSSLGHFVDTETSPTKVLERDFKQKVDLLVSDIEMPDMNGFEFISRFKEKPMMKSIPIIMLTASAEIEKIKSAASAGAMDYIVKPLDKEVGVVKLKKLIDRISASEVHLPQNSKNSQATANFNVSIVSVGENFVKILTNFAVPTGSKLHLNGTLFEELSLKVGSLDVEECSPTEDGFILFLRFPNLGKAAQESLRDWMNRFK